MGSGTEVLDRVGFMTRNVAREALILLLAIFIPVPMESQQAPIPPQAPIFRVQSSLVLVDVITQDRKTGLPTQDFKKEDFRLFDNGREVPINTFDAGAGYDTRPITLWLVVICNEGGVPEFGASAEFLGQESLFRPALNHLETHDRVGVAHWCDNGYSGLDLLPTEDRDQAIQELADTLKPIPFEGGTSASDEAGEQAFRKLIRLIIRDAYGRNPKPLPVIVFLHGDYTGQPHSELDKLVDDFLETSGIVFGIRDYRSPNLHIPIGEQAAIMHYMAKQTGGQYFSVPPSEYAATLATVLMQLHFRYELGFIPPAIDGRRHELRVELTNEGKKKHKGVRLRFRPEYIPVTEEPEWVQ